MEKFINKEQLKKIIIENDRLKEENEELKARLEIIEKKNIDLNFIKTYSDEELTTICQENDDLKQLSNKYLEIINELTRNNKILKVQLNQLNNENIELNQQLELFNEKFIIKNIIYEELEKQLSKLINAFLDLRDNFTHLTNYYKKDLKKIRKLNDHVDNLEYELNQLKLNLK